MKYRQKGEKYLCKTCGMFVKPLIDEWGDCYKYYCQNTYNESLFGENYKCFTVVKIVWKSKEQIKKQWIDHWKKVIKNEKCIEKVEKLKILLKELEK